MAPLIPHSWPWGAVNESQTRSALDHSQAWGLLSEGSTSRLGLWCGEKAVMWLREGCSNSAQVPGVAHLEGF